MGKLRMSAAIAALTLLSMVCGALPQAAATVHEPETCWDPDVEFPVPCDDDGD